MSQNRSAEPRNTDALRGMRCPHCSSLGPFRIGVTAWATVQDSGVVSTTDIAWADHSPCECIRCSHHAQVDDFKIPFHVPGDVHYVFTQDFPYVLDAMETTVECTGYSLYEYYSIPVTDDTPSDDQDGTTEVYSFATVDEQGVQIYASSPHLAKVPAGEYEDVTSDEGDSLSVSIDSHDADEIRSRLQALWHAVETFFLAPTPTAP